MKNTILTSTLAILIAGPAIAAVGDDTFTANQTTETGMCVIGVTGVASGDANANPLWTPRTYSCAAGYYLPDGTNWTGLDDGCAQCTAGNYCAGSGNGTFTYSEANDQGITSCGSTYTHSDLGSDSVDDCYRDCAAADVAHLKENGSVTGRYYSTNTNECEPANDQQCATGYHYAAGPDLTTAIGNTAGTGYGYKPNSGSSGSNASDYDLTENGTWAVNYGTGKGVIKGKSQCSTRSATYPWVGSDGAYVLQSDSTTTTLPDSTGQYCYCQLTEYTPDGGSAQSLSAPWVFGKDMGDAGDCGYYCVDVCAGGLQNNHPHNLAFRAAVFGSLGTPGPASCDANTISINWKDAAGGTHALGSCTYDGAITTPTTAPTKRGHTFGGWKFVAPVQN